jgi:predicted DNA-binding transcriptional regulator YafY
MLRRQWEILRALSTRRYGLSVEEIEEETRISRSTVYRDLATLRDAGIPLSAPNGESGGRYRLFAARELPATTLTGLQVAALFLAREALEPLSGADFVAELDQLLEGLRDRHGQQSFAFARRGVPRADVLQVLTRAMRGRRRVRMEYRARERGGAAKSSLVEPLFIRVAGSGPYLRAYSLEHGAERTYKIARIAHAEATLEQATHKARAESAQAFRHSLKAWSGEPETIAVRLDPAVAWLADEYPLPEQRTRVEPDGSLIVEGRVSGLVEARGYVLSWGAAAEALAPASLREATRVELLGALGKYEPPGPAKVDGKRARSPRALAAEVAASGSSPNDVPRRTQAGTGRS